MKILSNLPETLRLASLGMNGAQNEAELSD